MLLTKNDVLIVGDWDADGAISTAIFAYLTRNSDFLSKEKLNLITIPSGPRELSGIVKEHTGCPGFLVLLDIPYVTEVKEVLAHLKRNCPETLVIYIDHHFSTIENLNDIKNFLYKYRVGKSKPTSLHLVDIAKELGVELPERLVLFAKSIGFIELGKKPDEKMMNTVHLVATIARALKLTKDQVFWNKMVKWLSNPLPIPMSKAEIEVLNKVSEEAKKEDEELEKAVTDLAIGAQRVGCFKWVDARKKWKRRGVSTLATRLSRKFKSPVALLASIKNGDLLVIRTKRDEAKSIAEELYSMGIAENIGGHGNIALVKLKKGYDVNQIKTILVKACHRLN